MASTTGTRARSVAAGIGIALYLGIVGYLLILLWRVVLLALIGHHPPDTAAAQLTGQASILLGAVTLASLYLYGGERNLRDLGLTAPTPRDFAWIGGAVAALYGINVVVEAIGIPLADHSIRAIGRSNPSVFLLLMVGSLVFVGPGEELLYRAIVQRAAARRLGSAGAIFIASVVFSGVHVFALADAQTSAIVGTLGVVFVLSVGLGILYARTDSLPVVAITHGVYDALAFATMYWEFAIA